MDEAEGDESQLEAELALVFLPLGERFFVVPDDEVCVAILSREVALGCCD